jgi:hypothetical protein
VMHDEDSVEEEEASAGELADEGAGTTIDTPQED